MAGIFSFCTAVPQNVLNYPEKASQRQRGKALGYSGCARCPRRPFLQQRYLFQIAFPRSSLSRADSSDAQMDKTFLEHPRQDTPHPKSASSQMSQLCWRTGLGKDPAGGESRRRCFFSCQQPLSPSSPLSRAFLWAGRIVKFIQREEIKHPSSQQQETHFLMEGQLDFNSKEHMLLPSASTAAPQHL